MIEVTNVKVVKLDINNKIRAVASVVINNAICIKDIKVLESEQGFFIGFPGVKTPKGEYKALTHPINQETREIIQKAIIEEFLK